MPYLLFSLKMKTISLLFSINKLKSIVYYRTIHQDNMGEGIDLLSYDLSLVSFYMSELQGFLYK